MLSFKIVDKNSIHLYIDEKGVSGLISKLEGLLLVSEIIIDVSNDNQLYRGKHLLGFCFKLADVGEYVYFEENYLYLEIEREMVDEFILFILNASKSGGFQTPEIISFLPKDQKDVGITIYGFWEQ